MFTNRFRFRQKGKSARVCSFYLPFLYGENRCLLLMANIKIYDLKSYGYIEFLDLKTAIGYNRIIKFLYWIKAVCKNGCQEQIP
ncbi:hypothetical protein D0T90_03530 [Neisseria animalis]|uniref:Uncharacterized protein n=1 Tax=Neisseria animalis TaxID=492 RepID=A0A5P3MSS2_NEIAN|nr:hypothetical protein D0T90_03530 [Neisseria animalis]